MQEDCLFCKIIAGGIPSKKQFENEKFYAFWDIKPKAPVHVLVAPKSHIQNLDEARESDKELLGEMLLTCQQIARDLDISGRYKVVTNIGELAGQTVFHMHFHLIGGWQSKEEVVSELKQG